MHLDAEEWMTPSQLQDWLSIGRSTAYELIRTGQIPSYRIGRIVRIRRQDADAWLEQNLYRPQERLDQERELS